jgi:GT2 family glycosyltransferase
MRPVSIVIPTWNGREILERNLPSVEEALARYADGGETIVVDDGSTDGTASWIASAHPGVRLLARAANEGFGAAANAGVAAARFGHVVLLNNDMRVEPDFLRGLIAPFAGGEDLFASTPRIVNRTFGGDEAVTAGGFRLGLFETRFPQRGSAPGASSQDEGDGNASEVLFACGGAAAFDRGRWLALGGLDPLYAPFYWEDVDLSWRARKRGWRIVHVPSSVVHHEHSATIGTRFTGRMVRAIYERNRLLFQWKNITSRRLAAVHLAWLPLRIARALAGRPDFLKGFYMASRRLGDALRGRRIEKAVSRRSDEELLRAFDTGGRRP